jgi:hypothetical protein
MTKRTVWHELAEHLFVEETDSCWPIAITSYQTHRYKCNGHEHIPALCE